MSDTKDIDVERLAEEKARLTRHIAGLQEQLSEAIRKKRHGEHVDGPWMVETNNMLADAKAELKRVNVLLDQARMAASAKRRAEEQRARADARQKRAEVHKDRCVVLLAAFKEVVKERCGMEAFLEMIREAERRVGEE